MPILVRHVIVGKKSVRIGEWVGLFNFELIGLVRGRFKPAHKIQEYCRNAVVHMKLHNFLMNINGSVKHLVYFTWCQLVH